MPDKTGKPLKIEKVENPKGGDHFPFFQINGMNRDDLAKNAPPQAMSPAMPPRAATAPTSNIGGGAIEKLDQIIQMLKDMQTDEKLPF